MLDSTITCPVCQTQSEETMPTNSCLFLFECPSCHTRLKPLKGDCCVFCSYGTYPCPPIQEHNQLTNDLNRDNKHFSLEREKT